MTDFPRKLLIFTNTIPHYRIPLFNDLSSYYQLHVIHHDPLLDIDAVSFHTHYIKCFEFSSFKVRFPTYINYLPHSYACIFLFDLHYLDLPLLLLITRFFSLPILWGIGVRASLTNSFDSPNLFDFVRLLYSRLARGLIFYSEYPIAKYSKFGISRDKLFVAHNTCPSIFLQKDDILSSFPLIKNSFVFVGTLYSEKFLDKVLIQYAEYTRRVTRPLFLIIVGDGPEYSSLVSLVHSLGIAKYVSFRGSITDLSELKNIYFSAVASLVIYQAGLSVVQSMSYGVPCISSDIAITGGERFNIIDQVTGLNIIPDKLSYSLEFCQSHPSFMRNLGLNAFDYFSTHLTMKSYCHSIRSAIVTLKSSTVSPS